MKNLTIGILGIDHRHIFGQLEGMESVGCICKAWWTQGEPETKEGFEKRFPTLERKETKAEILNDPEIDLILIADIPARRSDLAIEAMLAGKDVMTDKPGCTTIAQLQEIRRTVESTGKIWSIDFSERFEVPAVTRAAELVQAGAIGTVIQTVGLGPHRLNRSTRPSWFFDESQYGGILCDIASHQIDQFLFFTGSSDAEIVTSTVGNFANPKDSGLQDFGEILLRSDNGQGYIRVDWYTPDALPNWGDGRLTILGTEGYIELRKYVDVAGRPGTDHVYLVNGESYEYIDASKDKLPYFECLRNDILHRTATAMPQSHCFKVMELALKAQANAVRVGSLNP